MAFAPRHIPLLLLVALVGAGCDVFSSPGLEQIDISYDGRTQLDRCDSAAFEVSVKASGIPIADPRLEITSNNEPRLQVVPTGDAIRTTDTCNDCSLTIRFLSSWVTDSVPTLRQRIDAQGGGPACP